jgi:hypothetical protein
MSLSYALIFATFAAASLLAAWQLHAPAGQVVLGWVGLSWLLVAAAYAGLGPRMLLKRRTGALPPLSWLPYGPFLLLSACLLRVRRLTMREAAYHQVVPGLYLGRRLTQDEAARAEELGPAAVLDMTAEFTEPLALRARPAYRLLATLDNTPPTVEQLQAGVEWIDRHIDAGGVYVHCAVGHGRSAVVAAAYLLWAGRAGSVEESLAMVRSARPGAKPQAKQVRVLRRFAAQHGQGAR